MTPAEAFAVWLRAARKQAGVSQQDIADHVGLYQQTIAKIEAGDRGISLDEAVAIASFFGATVTEVIGSTAASLGTTKALADNARLRQFIADNARLRRLIANIHDLTKDGAL